MNDIEILQELNRFETAETAYKALYTTNPYDTLPPAKDWNDFITNYRDAMTTPIELPTKPISDISTYFYESQFFTPNTIMPAVPSKDAFSLVYPPVAASECVIFKHLRYLPIFFHSLEFVKLSYVVQGSCQFYVQNTVHTLTAGSLIVVGPNTEQSFFAPHDEDIVLNIIMRTSSFEKLFLPMLRESNDLSDHFWRILYEKDFSSILLFHCRDNSELLHLILQLYYESQINTPPSLLVINSYVSLLFAQLVRHHMDTVEKLSGKAVSSTAPKILQFITDNKSQVTLQMVAEHFHLSQGYLSRYIKAHTGYTFSAFLQRLRLKEATYLLCHTNLSVEEIVYKIGYTDVSHFYRSFKSHYHMTPNRFRQENT